MNEAERELVTYLTEIKSEKIGFMELRTDVPGWCADISLDARYDLFAPECIFDDCDDAEAKLFLEAFLAKNLSVSWSVSVQLSKLLANRGQLVCHIVEPLLFTLDWTCVASEQLYLSYLANMKDGAVRAEKLLDQVREDFRDGLFLACHRLQSEKLDRKLIAKFVEWDAGGWSPTSTGNIYALEQFIARWLGVYPFPDLEGVIRIYFKWRKDD